MYETVLPPAVLGTTILAQSSVPPASNAAAVAGRAMLPVTGFAIGGLLVAALVLIITGVVLRLVARHAELPAVV